jgi:hypothetical protein
LEMNDRGFTKWSQSTVWAAETGSRPVRLEEAVEIAKILGVHVDVLTEYDDLMQVLREVNEVRLDGRSFVAAAVRLHATRRRASLALEKSGRSAAELELDAEAEYFLATSLAELANNALRDRG